jgi:hypothetical protein
MHRGLPCTKENVSIHDAFMMLSPKLCYNDLILLQNASCEDGPTGDDMCMLFN